MDYTKYQPYLNFINKYKKASNASTGSQFDSNANVEKKNVTTLTGELYKGDAIGINRLMMHEKISEMYGNELADEYIRQLDNHEIYRHDETNPLLPYCVSITMYPFLFYGLKPIGGVSEAPKGLNSFAGSFINLVFAIASQFAGAVATPEFLSYLDYFIRKEYGNDYYLKADKQADCTERKRSIDEVICNIFQQIVYSLNQPAAARNFQSVFWNIAYFDKPYFEGIFEDFVFPDGTGMQWESVSWLQKRFMNWFNEERLRVPLTFPVETLNLLNDENGYVDKEWEDFAAEMWAKGHSFFLYRSDSIDSLASCCRLRNGITNNTFSFTLGAGGVSTGSKAVISININRLIQKAKRDNKDISETIRNYAQKIHKYLTAYNEILKDNLSSGLLPIYDCGYISLEKQYLTIGIQGFVEGAEFLGIEPKANNEEYYKYGEMILRPIYEEKKKAKTKEVMFNTEFVPKMCVHKVA